MPFDVYEALLPAITYDDFVLMAQNCNPEYTTLRDEVRKLLAQRRNELWEMFLEHEEDIMRAAFPEKYTVNLSYDGKHVYTIDDFPCCGKLHIGEYVDWCVVQDLMDVLPPAYYSSSLAQLGEPHDHIPMDGKYYPTYATFRFVAIAGSDEVWKYCGNCLKGWATEPKEI